MGLLKCDGMAAVAASPSLNRHRGPAVDSSFREQLDRLVVEELADGRHATEAEVLDEIRAWLDRRRRSLPSDGGEAGQESPDPGAFIGGLSVEESALLDEIVHDAYRRRGAEVDASQVSGGRGTDA